MERSRTDHLFGPAAEARTWPCADGGLAAPGWYSAEAACRLVLPRTANVLDTMPKSAQLGAKKVIQDICNAEDRQRAEAAIRTFAELHGTKFPRTVKKITDDEPELPAFYDFPAEHWIHLRTPNPVESTFTTVRLRTKATRSDGSRPAALAIVFKLVEPAQQR
ncbi:transposase [Streptomyces sp. NPDC056190]|uniref:transposase n=1 Tax=Streptomyces sp. NPDC056190 TaxID=3345741 RepID=UPI0035D756ED